MHRTMRILFLSPVQPLLTSGEPLPRWQMQASWVRALQRLGHEIKVVKYTPNDRIRLGWGERIRWNIRVIREIRGFGSGCLIIYSLGADVLLPQAIQYIKSRLRAPLVVLSGVSPIKDGNPRERAMAPLVDLAATNDGGHAREWLRLGAKRAVVLPIAAIDPELHYPRFQDDPRRHFFNALGAESSLTSSSPLGKSKSVVLSGSSSMVSKMPPSAHLLRRIRAIRGNGRDVDVLFAGTLTAERGKFFDKLRRLLPKTVKMVVKKFRWEEEYARLMSRAKIGINLLRPEMKNGVNLRTFEIPAFGAMEITSFCWKEWLVPGKEVEVFGTVGEAAELVKRYLRDGKAREKMAAAAQERVEREHTFDGRAKRLMEILGEKEQKEKKDQKGEGNSVDVSVCIVNYKTDKELARCLDSIKKFTKGVIYETIVIDNSTDNRWYSGGNNLALKQARGKYVLFLNPDCWLENDAVTGLVNFMDKRPRAGAAEPRQAYESGEIAPTGSLRPRWWIDMVEMTGLWRWFGRLGGLGALGKLGRLGKFGELDQYRQIHLDRAKNWRTEAVSGAAMITRREILDKVGGFDERLRMYYTDVDLCRRIKDAGWEIWHVGEEAVRHTARGSTSKLPWDRINLIYAHDGRNYYRKWGERIQGNVLYWMMIMNLWMAKFLGSNKVRPRRTSGLDLSAVIIASGSEDGEKLKTAIESVGFADEVLVEKIAAPIRDFSKVRNEALRKARGEWVVFVDSDEEIGEEVKKEIRQITDKSYKDYKNNNISGAYFRRRDRFLGRWLSRGETASVRLLRLGRRGAGKWERPVHEVWKIGGRIGKLRQPILHYSHDSVDGMVEKLDRYSEIEAEYRVSRRLARWRNLLVRRHPSSRRPSGLRASPSPDVTSGSGWPQTAAVSLANLPTSLTFLARNFLKLIILTQLIFFPIFKFVQNYFLRLGVLDGMEGLIHALLMSWHSFLVRAKILWRYE